MLGSGTAGGLTIQSAGEPAMIDEMAEKSKEVVPSQIDELTAANSSNHCGATTTFSVGMSPANISMMQR